MPNAAAATSAARQRKRLSEEKKRRRRIRKNKIHQDYLERERRLSTDRAELAFKTLSTDGGKTINALDVHDFLAEVILCKRSDLDNDAVQLVVDTVSREQQQQKQQEQAKATSNQIYIPNNNINNGELQLEKHILLKAVEKYGEYVRSAKKIEELYEKFDYNHDGCLSRDELRDALQTMERNRKHEVHGKPAIIFVFEEDLDLILKQSDIGGDGQLSRNEVLPALATWEKLVKLKLEEQENCNCCTIL